MAEEVETIEQRELHPVRRVTDNLSQLSTGTLRMAAPKGTKPSETTNPILPSENFVLLMGTVDSTNDTIDLLTEGCLPVRSSIGKYPVLGMSGGTPTEYKRRATSSGAGGAITLTLTVPSGGFVEIDDIRILATTLSAGESILLDIMDSDDNIRRTAFAATNLTASGKWLQLPYPLSRAAFGEDVATGMDPSEIPYKLYASQYLSFTTSALTAADVIDFTISYRSWEAGTLTEATVGNVTMSAIP